MYQMFPKTAHTITPTAISVRAKSSNPVSPRKIPMRVDATPNANNHGDNRTTRFTKVVVLDSLSVEFHHCSPDLTKYLVAIR